MADNEERALAEVGAEVPAKVEERQDDIFDGLAREIVSREVAHRDGRPEGRSLVVEIPQDGEGGADIISYGRSDMIGELDRVLDKDKVKHRGIEVNAGVTEAPEQMAKLGEMARRQVSEATSVRKALEAKVGLPALPGAFEALVEKFESKLPALPGSEVIEEGGQESGTSESED
ncbi:unnamed protein product [marine sediment metagenome]|uniref:Uncharacterized protein n=1 Tax=marine sediment metagenome TaxID=412755 RepID=X1RWJ2_9ZZZZ